MADTTSGRGSTTLVIKRGDEGEEAGHHGGAWKIAYADFVTAMMAFFLLMWLINATTEEQRTGLADYFAPTNLLGRTASGSGQPFGGRSPNDPGVSVSTAGRPVVTPGRQPQAQDDDPDDVAEPVRLRAPLEGAKEEDATGQGPDSAPGASKGIQQGRGEQKLVLGGDYAAAAVLPPPPPVAAPPSAAQANAAALRSAAQDDAERERRALRQAGAALMDAIRRDPALADAAGQLSIQTVPEGLRIQVVDAERRPMFSLGGATPTPQVRELMRKVAGVLAPLPNAISIAGHTDALVFRAGGDKGNWELSTDRANATRRVLMEAGLAEGRIRSVTGNADRDLLLPAEPLNAANRRISIIVLRHAGPAGAAS